MLNFLKFLRTYYRFWFRKGLSAGTGVHICRDTKLWAPDFIQIDSHAYIGKEVLIEANFILGKAGMIANRVMVIGRNDHNMRQLGVPIRYARDLRSMPKELRLKQVAIIEDDVWVGAGAIILAPIKIGKGSVVAAGSVVVKDVPPYAIVGGSPASIIGYRFSDKEIADHEYGVSKYLRRCGS